MKLIISILMTFILSMSSAIAKEEVDVITRYSAASAVGQIMITLIKKMNSSQEKYSFKFSNIPGANGETAAVSAIEYAKNGKKVLWYGPISTFTIVGVDKNVASIRKWNVNDFTFISGVSSSTFGVMVSPQSNINTIDELIAKLKNKDKIYTGNTVSTNSVAFLDKIFTRHYKLEDKRIYIEYKNFSDVVQAVLNGEIDYTIHNIADMPSLKMILLASNERISLMPNVPTAPEVNFNDFYVSTVSTLAVPNGNHELIEDIKNMSKSFCGDKDLEFEMNKRRYVSKMCLTPKDIKDIINDEKIKINNFKG